MNKLKDVFYCFIIIMIPCVIMGIYLWYESPISETNYKSNAIVVDKYTTFPKHRVYHIVFEDGDRRAKFTVNKATWDKIDIGDSLYVDYDRFEYRHDNIGYKVNTYQMQ